MQNLPKVKDFLNLYGEQLKQGTLHIVLDFDGTLADITEDYRDSKIPSSTQEALTSLNRKTQGNVSILSGRPVAFLKEVLPDDIELIGEYGATANSKNTAINFDYLKPLLDKLSSQYPKSKLEVKDFSIVWHYREFQDEISSKELQEIEDLFTEKLKDRDENVFHYNCVLEVKRVDFTKLNYFITKKEKSPHDLYFYAGDETSDEEVFTHFKADEKFISVAINREVSEAKFKLSGAREFREWIEELSHNI